MNTSSPNFEPPSVMFEFMPNDAINACAHLDFLPENGLRIDVREEWGADRFVITVHRTGLRVSFDASFFHLQGLEQTLGAVRKKITERADRAMGISQKGTKETKEKKWMPGDFLQEAAEAAERTEGET